MKLNIFIKPNTYIYLTLLLLIIRIQWFISWLIAVLFHELCHYIVVKLCKGNVDIIEADLSGIKMHCDNLSNICRIVAILSGPLGGFLLCTLGRSFPRLAVCSFFLSIYNLLPILPLDGGQALKIILKSRKMFKYIQIVFLLLLCIASFYAALYLHLGILPFVIVIGIYLKHRNIPCKESICRVQ